MSLGRKQVEFLATPPWADFRKIYAIYNEAADRRDAGEDVQVDHIVPLVHPLVCGLHYEMNLQIISARENSYKSNFFQDSNHEHI